MQDIIYIPVNVQFSRRSQRSKRAKLNKKDIKNLQKYNKADFKPETVFFETASIQIESQSLHLEFEIVDPF
jgi:hypothetical protein